jgi:uncharacterized Tic20 family protein
MLNIVEKSCAQKDYSFSPQALQRLRLFTVMALIGFPTFSVLEMFNLLDGFSKPVHFILTLALLMSFVPLVGNRIYNHFSRSGGRLDEREKEAVERAMSFSYRAVIITLIVSIIIGLALTYLLGASIRMPVFTIAAVAMIAMNIAFLLMFLPIAHIAWTQKPLPAESE